MRLPTIVLVGGPFVDGMKRMDSRQPMKRDPTCALITAGLARSQPWWEVVASLPAALLGDALGAGAVLIDGPRSLHAPSAVSAVNWARDNKTTRLRRLLDGPVGKLTRQTSVVEGHFDVQWNANPPDASWYFLDPSGSAMRDFPPARELGLAVMIHARPLDYDPPQLVEKLGINPYAADKIKLRFEPWTEAVVIVPDTANMRSVLDALIYWQGRKPRARRKETPYIDPFDYSDEKASSAQVRVTSAEFGVTGLVADGRWADPSMLALPSHLLQTAPIPPGDLTRPSEFNSPPKKPRRKRTRPLKEKIFDDLSLALKPAGWERTWNRLNLSSGVSHRVWCEIEVRSRWTEIWVAGELDAEDYDGWLDDHRAELGRLSPAALNNFGAGEATRSWEWARWIWRANGGKADDVDWQQRGREIADATAALRSVLANFPVPVVEDLRPEVAEEKENGEDDPAAFLSGLWDSRREESEDDPLAWLAALPHYRRENSAD